MLFRLICPSYRHYYPMFRFLWNRTAGNVEQEAAKRLAETKLMKDLAAMARGLIHGDVYNPADPRTHHLKDDTNPTHHKLASNMNVVTKNLRIARAAMSAAAKALIESEEAIKHPPNTQHKHHHKSHPQSTNKKPQG